MSLQKLGTVLAGVGFSQVILYPFHKRYQERNHAEMHELLKEHRSLIEQAQTELNSRTSKSRSNQQ